MFQRHMETARWAVPQGQHTQLFIPPPTPLQDSPNSHAKLSDKPGLQFTVWTIVCLPVHPFDLEK